MLIILRVIAALGLAYLALELAFYALPAWAARRRPGARIPSDDGVGFRPRVIVLTACRDGAECLPGLAKSVFEQNYPADRRRLFLIADNCSDNTAPLARELGMEVYERHNAYATGKGNALNEVLSAGVLGNQFDVLWVLDVDARLDRNFLRRAARYFSAPVAQVVSGVTFAKNPDETLLAHIGTLIQALLRLHQQGRAALGWDAALYGSHGYALSYRALELLGWQTTTGQIAEDMEVRLRCTLHGIPIRYAADLTVLNDVTATASDVHHQRRRWNSTYLPLIPQYVGPLARRWLRGDAGAFDALFGLLLLPSYANLFLYLTLAVLGCWALERIDPAFRACTGIALGLWALDILYFIVAFRTMRIRLGWREWKGFALHLGLRGAALVESVFFAHVKIWPPAPHKQDHVD